MILTRGSQAADLFQFGQRAVGAAVVDENDLVVLGPVLYRRGDLPVEQADVFGFVEDRDDDGNQCLFHWLFLTQLGDYYKAGQNRGDDTVGVASTGHATHCPYPI